MCVCVCIVQTYVVRRCLFADSWASANAGALDMELYDTTTASTLSVYDCVFRNCTAGGGGGGLYIIFQSETREFVATVRWARAPAALPRKTRARRNCTFEGNKGTRGGALSWYGDASSVTRGMQLRVYRCGASLPVASSRAVRCAASG